MTMIFKATPGFVKGRELTAGERDELRHYLQVLMENTRLVRNAIEPQTGRLGLSVGHWRSQWAALKRDLDSVTERVSKGHPGVSDLCMRLHLRGRGMDVDEACSTILNRQSITREELTEILTELWNSGVAHGIDYG